MHASSVKRAEVKPPQVSKLTVTLSSSLKSLPPPESLVFGGVRKFGTDSVDFWLTTDVI